MDDAPFFITRIGFLDSKMYVFGEQPAQKYKPPITLLLVYDKQLDKLDEVLRIQSHSTVEGAITGERLFYAERGNLLGSKDPNVTIFNLEQEAEEAKIIGEGIGPNPVMSLTKISLGLLALPFLWLLRLLISIF